MKKNISNRKDTSFYSFLIGMASIFYPRIIRIHHISEDSASADIENMSKDWQAVGSYISNAYEIIQRLEI